MTKEQLTAVLAQAFQTASDHDEIGGTLYREDHIEDDAEYLAGLALRTIERAGWTLSPPWPKEPCPCCGADPWGLHTAACVIRLHLAANPNEQRTPAELWGVLNTTSNPRTL